MRPFTRPRLLRLLSVSGTTVAVFVGRFRTARLPRRPWRESMSRVSLLYVLCLSRQYIIMCVPHFDRACSRWYGPQTWLMPRDVRVHGTCSRQHSKRTYHILQAVSKFWSSLKGNLVAILVTGV